MNRTILIVLVVVMLLLPTKQGLSQRTWDPLQGADEIVEWFARLNDSFEIIVKKEETAQLIRSVDQVRRSLYLLEVDTTTLRDQITPDAPKGQALVHLRDLVSQMIERVGALQTAVRTLGADLRLEDDASRVEDALTFGLRTRARILSYMEQALIEAQSDVWNSGEIRDHLNTGLAAVHTAQVTVTEFQRRLSPSSAR